MIFQTNLYLLIVREKDYRWACKGGGDKIAPLRPCSMKGHFKNGGIYGKNNDT